MNGVTMKKIPDAQLRVALLRGINVGGNKKVPMAELRELAAGLGWQRAETYIQSGNLVFAANGGDAEAEQALEGAIAAHFGFVVPVVVRSVAAWRAYAAASPFPEAASARPNLLHLGLSKRRPQTGAADALAKYATSGEGIEIQGDAVWIDYAGGVARSKLTPAVLDRAIGSSVTMRNWKTVQQLAAMLGA